MKKITAFKSKRKDWSCWCVSSSSGLVPSAVFVSCLCGSSFSEPVFKWRCFFVLQWNKQASLWALNFVTCVVDIPLSNQRASWPPPAFSVVIEDPWFCPGGQIRRKKRDEGAAWSILLVMTQQVSRYKETSVLGLSPRKQWPGCSASPPSWSAALSCCRAKLQVNHLKPTFLSDYPSLWSCQRPQVCQVFCQVHTA